MWFGFAAEKEWQNAREKEQAAIAKETELQSTIKELTSMCQEISIVLFLHGVP